MKVGDRVERMATHANYKIIDMNQGGKIVLQRLINGGKCENIIKVNDLSSFRLFKPIKDTISFFDDDYDFLSNLFKSPTEFDGDTYPSVEHAFQASKTNSKEEREKLKNISSPLKAKVFGMQIKPDKEWEKQKYNYMYSICLSKFKNNEDLKRRLLETNDLTLINSCNDTYWGISKDVGENNLGKILMDIRKELTT